MDGGLWYMMDEQKEWKNRGNHDKLQDRSDQSNRTYRQLKPM